MVDSRRGTEARFRHPLSTILLSTFFLPRSAASRQQVQVRSAIADKRAYDADLPPRRHRAARVSRAAADDQEHASDQRAADDVAGDAEVSRRKRGRVLQ